MTAQQCESKVKKLSGYKQGTVVVWIRNAAAESLANLRICHGILRYQRFQTYKNISSMFCVFVFL